MAGQFGDQQYLRTQLHLVSVTAGISTSAGEVVNLLRRPGIPTGTLAGKRISTMRPHPKLNLAHTGDASAAGSPSFSRKLSWRYSRLKQAEFAVAPDERRRPGRVLPKSKMIPREGHHPHPVATPVPDVKLPALQKKKDV